jgi:hypothetical protein
MDGRNYCEQESNYFSGNHRRSEEPGSNDDADEKQHHVDLSMINVVHQQQKLASISAGPGEISRNVDQNLENLRLSDRADRHHVVFQDIPPPPEDGDRDDEYEEAQRVRLLAAPQGSSPFAIEFTLGDGNFNQACHCRVHSSCFCHT